MNLDSQDSFHLLMACFLKTYPSRITPTHQNNQWQVQNKCCILFMFSFVSWWARTVPMIRKYWITSKCSYRVVTGLQEAIGITLQNRFGQKRETFLHFCVLQTNVSDTDRFVGIGREQVNDLSNSWKSARIHAKKSNVFRKEIKRDASSNGIPLDS